MDTAKIILKGDNRNIKVYLDLGAREKDQELNPTQLAALMLYVEGKKNLETLMNELDEEENNGEKK